LCHAALVEDPRRGKIDWSEGADLVTESYVLTAPKLLAARLELGQ
jgi:hypothetical protein